MPKITFFILFPLAVFCQSNPFDGYSELSKFEGDFNGDKQIDQIIIYEKNCEDTDYTMEDSRCRRVAIFLKDKDQYHLYGYNDDVIECSKCGGAGVGDPFQGITVKNQFFSIECLYGACDKTFEVTTFKFESKSKEFYLYKIGTEDYSCREEDNADGEIKVKADIKTKKDFGKVKFSSYKNQ
jgi:hypothetical protein